MTGGSTLSPFLPQGKSPNTSRRGNSTSMLKLRNAQGSGVPTMQTGFLLQSLSTVLLASCLLVLLLAPEFSTANTLTPRQQGEAISYMTVNFIIHFVTAEMCAFMLLFTGGR